MISPFNSASRNRWTATAIFFLEFLLLSYIPVCKPSYTTDVLRPRFEKAFTDRCTSEKYPFIDRYYKNLENPNNRFVHFVLHEHGLHNGGFGDRIAGLISATAIALRLNRTLLVESGNGFDQLFRPYHPNATFYKDSSNYSVSTYNYGNWTSWTPYDYKNANNDATELDLFNCINIRGDWTDKCGMSNGDVPQPIIKIRGNRAYLCKWKLENKKANSEMKELGMTDSTDLFEMSGCMLRLAMWPTEKLWAYVDRILTEDTIKLRLQTSLASPASTSVSVGSGASASPDLPQWDYQVGVHFRCGDRSYMKGGGGMDRACQHLIDERTKEESDYMRYGTPVDVGECAREVIHNITSSNKALLASGVLLFVASDNSGSASQMKETVGWADTIVSPHGCHTEMDSSLECSELTLGNWLVLAMSDVIVTQTDTSPNLLPSYGGPISAFSRYATYYGLKQDSWRNSKNCSLSPNPLLSATIQHGNWFCS